jgi:hemerythrin-like domain-containing protein
MTTFNNGESPDYDLVFQIVEFLLDFPSRCHHPKEDVLYRLLADTTANLPAGLANLSLEHEELDKLTSRFSDMLASVLGEAGMPRETVMKELENFTAYQRRHMQMEEAVFFPALESGLSTRDWDALAERVHNSDDPVFGSTAAENFITQCEKIAKTADFVLEN